MMETYSNKHSVSIVIPNYNGEKLLQENLPFVISAFKNKANKILEIIVVDDASTDKSVEVIKSKFPEVRLIKHRKNRRFPSAVNTGVRSAKGDLICLLNTDVSPKADFLKSVLPHFKEYKLFGVSLSEEGYSWSIGKFEKGFVEHTPGIKNSSSHDTFWLSGGSCVVRRDIWIKLKGFDESLFTPFYWEDIDISYRALKRGYRLLWEPKAQVMHIHESTNKIFNKKYKSRIQERNQLLFMWKNITSPRFTRKHMNGLIRRVAKHPGYIRIVMIAIVKIRKVWKLRKIEKKESIVSDESIFARFNNV